MKKAVKSKSRATKRVAPQASGRRKPPVVLVLEKAPLPRWAAVDHELWLGDVLIKRFRRPAPVVQLILAVFQEEGWPERIDDPLSPRAGRSEKTRLRNAVQSLNRRLQNHALRFEMDGHGAGITWRMES